MATPVVEVKQVDGMWRIMVNSPQGFTQTPVRTINGDIVVYGRREDAVFMLDYWLAKGLYGPTWG